MNDSLSQKIPHIGIIAAIEREAKPHIQLRGITDLANNQEQVRTEFESRVIEVSHKLVEYILCGISGVFSNEKISSDE